MHPYQAVMAVMGQSTLSGEELACIALVVLSNRLMPGWQDIAEVARQGDAA
jgi:hypothetical protein